MKKPFVLLLVGLAACGDACEGSSEPSAIPPAATATANPRPGPSGRMMPRVHLGAPPVEQEAGAAAPSAVP